MKKKHQGSVAESFANDIIMISTELNNQPIGMVGYALYACFEDDKGVRMHMTSFDSTELDTLLGRIEILKSFIINRMADLGEKGVDDDESKEITPDVSDILKKFTKDDGSTRHL